MGPAVERDRRASPRWRCPDRPDEVLVTYSLGSCIGLSLYDPVARVGGLLHAMLPLSSLDPVKAAANARRCSPTPA